MRPTINNITVSRFYNITTLRLYCLLFFKYDPKLFEVFLKEAFAKDLLIKIPVGLHYELFGSFGIHPNEPI